MKTTKRTKLIAATFTPLHKDGSLALGQIDLHREFLKNQGAVDGVFICGTTGEGVSLTSAERRHVAERWSAVSDNDLEVIVHVGHTSAEEGRQLAQHAQEVGAHGVAAIGPFFFRPKTVSDLVEFCMRIAEGAPDLRFYYYHIPLLTGVNISMPAFLQEATARIPNFGGIKYTDANLMDFSFCREEAQPDQQILFGWDEIMLAALSLGATGFVGSTYSYIAPLYRRLIDSFEEGDLVQARRAQRASQEVVKVLNQHGGLSAGKVMMKLAGIDHGPPRPPLREEGLEDCQQMESKLRKIGFFDWIQPASTTGSVPAQANG